MSIAHSQSLQRLIGDTFVERALLSAVSWAQLRLLRGHKPPSVVQLVRNVRRERTSLQSPNELFLVHSLASSCRNLFGAYAEVGVYQGASARLISAGAPGKMLHLFDTFEGLPKSNDGVHRKGQFACNLAAVRSYVGAWNIEYHQGIFPESIRGTELDDTPPRFAFVHLDVDLYDSTLDCLRWFYPRMTRGGVILTHDYSLLAGVKKAFDLFLVDKPERAIEMPTTQAMLVKL